MLREDGNFPDRIEAFGRPLRHTPATIGPTHILCPAALSRGAAGQVFAPRRGRVLASINAGVRRELSNVRMMI